MALAVPAAQAIAKPAAAIRHGRAATVALSEDCTLAVAMANACRE
jgi:hypothetical protein